MTTVELALVDPGQGEARAMLREYFRDIVARYHGRPADEAEIDDLMAADPSHELAAPHGLFLLARSGPSGRTVTAAPGETLGCAGMALLPGGIGEVKRVFVRPHARGRGIGARLLTELEVLARGHGLHTLRLDTRSDLVEARRLYLRQGYREVPAFNSGPYCEHWYAKALDPVG
jgi:GNAT superfamily N-acetyltransferase